MLSAKGILHLGRAVSSLSWLAQPEYSKIHGIYQASESSVRLGGISSGNI